MTIFRSVVAIVINAIKSGSTGTRPHIRVEVHEASSPSRTNLYPSCSILLPIAPGVWICASGEHCSPASVLRRKRHSMRHSCPPDGRRCLSDQAAAAPDRARRKMLCWNAVLPTALAKAAPYDTASATLDCGTDRLQPTKQLSRQIDHAANLPEQLSHHKHFVLSCSN
jgi:hypothetical protein